MRHNAGKYSCLIVLSTEQDNLTDLIAVLGRMVNVGIDKIADKYFSQNVISKYFV